MSRRRNEVYAEGRGESDRGTPSQVLKRSLDLLSLGNVLVLLSLLLPRVGGCHHCMLLRFVHNLCLAHQSVRHPFYQQRWVSVTSMKAGANGQSHTRCVESERAGKTYDLLYAHGVNFAHG